MDKEQTPVIEKKRRPKGTKFAQQTHWAWEPKINMYTTGLWMAGFGAPILLLGIILVFTTASDEIVVPYGTHSTCLNCRNVAATRISNHCKSCLPKAGTCSCSIRFRVPRYLQTPVMVYYQLENFYQSHRRYIKSRDNSQLWGKILDKDYKPIKPDSNCKPYDKQGKFYTYPCGAIANSMFSDKLEIKSTGGIQLDISKQDTAWNEDLNYKFRNPQGLDKKTYDKKVSRESLAFNKHFSKPADWEQILWEKFWRDGGTQGNDFVNWMSPSPFAKLRKFYGVINSVPSCTDPRVLCKGEYELNIDYQFPVDPYKGQKSLVLATTSFLGTPNPFIKWFTLGFGILLCSLSALFIVLHKTYKKINRKRIQPNHHHHHFEAIVDRTPPLSERDESEFTEIEMTDTEMEPSDTESSRANIIRDRSSPLQNFVQRSDNHHLPPAQSSNQRVLTPTRHSPQVDPRAIKNKERHAPRFIKAHHVHHPHSLSKYHSKHVKSRSEGNRKRAKSAPSSKPPLDNELLESILDRPKSNPKSTKLKIL